MSGGQIMVVLIVMIACTAGILKARYNAGRSRPGDPGAIDAERNGQNLSSAIRVFVLSAFRERADGPVVSAGCREG